MSERTICLFIITNSGSATQPRNYSVVSTAAFLWLRSSQSSSKQIFENFSKPSGTTWALHQSLYWFLRFLSGSRTTCTIQSCKVVLTVSHYCTPHFRTASKIPEARIYIIFSWIDCWQLSATNDFLHISHISLCPNSVCSYLKDYVM